jgi:hypothetical protein
MCPGSQGRSSVLDNLFPDGFEVTQQIRVGSSLAQDTLNRRAGRPYRSSQRDQFGDWTPIHADPEPLSSFDPTQDLGSVITQVT